MSWYISNYAYFDYEVTFDLSDVNLCNKKTFLACLRNNWDYWGADIPGKNFKVKGGVNACIRECRKTAGCKSLAFRPSDGQCWLKNKENGARSKPQSNRQSINMSCAEPKRKFTFHLHEFITKLKMSEIFDTFYILDT